MLSLSSSRVFSKGTNAYRIFLLPCELTWRDEHEPNGGIITLFLLDSALECVDMERHAKAIDRQNDGLLLVVDHNLVRKVRAMSLTGNDGTYSLILNLWRKLILPLVRFKPFPLLLFNGVFTVRVSRILLHAFHLTSLSEFLLMILPPRRRRFVVFSTLVSQFGFQNGTSTRGRRWGFAGRGSVGFGLGFVLWFGFRFLHIVSTNKNQKDHDRHNVPGKRT